MCLTVKYLPASNQILYANKQKPPTSTPSCKQKTPPLRKLQHSKQRIKIFLAGGVHYNETVYKPP